VKRREDWFDGQLDPERLVFIDETWATTNMARLRGRAPKGERLRGGIPHGHWKTTTFVAGLRLSGMVAPLVLDGPINGIAFQAYVDRILVPTLQPGDIVIMDNVGSHKGADVRAAIKAAGTASLPSALQPGLQSHRKRLFETQGAAAQGCGANRRRSLGYNRRLGPCLHANRMCKLLRCRRLRTGLKRIRFSALTASGPTWRGRRWRRERPPFSIYNNLIIIGLIHN
jgi:hypothetical protein